MRALILGCASIAVVWVYEGSDQMRWPEKMGEAIDAIEQAPFLTEDQKRDILCHNAVRFLHLEEDASGARPSKEE